MNRPEYRIPEEKTQEVFTLAAKLYAQHNQSYTVKELMEAGDEAQIPPEFIEKAINQIQVQEFSNQQALAKKQNNRSKLLVGGLLTGLLALGGLYFLTKNTPSQAGVGTTNPNEPIATNPVGGNFKCANLNLVGADLRSENLRGADCTKANLSGANLSSVNLEGANLSGADLSNANLKGANLNGADLAGANLVGADLNGANLERANISNTDLRDADLRNAKLNGADTAGAKLEGARK